MPAEKSTPFARFAPMIRTPDAHRSAITAAIRTPEPVCVPPLVEAATVPDAVRRAAAGTARALIEGLRGSKARGGVQALVQEYALSSQEGVALMCLAEALLRIPDTATRDALIRDKIGGGDWASHIGDGRSLFVNAATWGLVVTGKLTASADDRGLATALTRLVARVGEPVIRRGVDLAMRMMGEQFVTGQTIDEALRHAKDREARGYGFSYDMLGEAATTAADAARYLRDYEAAIHAIGKASEGRGVYGGPGISIKLSALHPRYSRAQAGRVMGELLPIVRGLALLAKGYDIGFNIDAEEADRLELSLDLLEALAEDPALDGWKGLGFVVQAYGKRCPLVIDFVIALARRTGRRIIIRLVKGAYWDAEIKRAQVDGLSGYPVYTRKIYTDVAYIACARKLLAARDAVFPQFATHNAQTLSTIYQLAGEDFVVGDYEFQCLHGMGEPLYDQVVGANGLARPCRVYAPVGTHETLLAYLVRRLLENGANSSFVNRIGDPAVPIDDLVADPVEIVRAMPVPGAPHDEIALPLDIYGERRNSAGLDLSDEATLLALGRSLVASAQREWSAGVDTGRAPVAIRNPADRRDVVGHVFEQDAQEAAAAVDRGAQVAAGWAATPVGERAACLERTADLLEQAMPTLLGLIMREAGKSAANAVAEVREAVDFLRYYALQGRETLGNTAPLGPIACISPWNFPLAIFTGQIAAALVAGNPVVAKPAQPTPLIAAEAVRLFHAAGVPEAVLQLVLGDGTVGAALVGAPQIAGVIFTGSTGVARTIQRQLAGRVTAQGRPIPLIAETGGQNAMIVDSSALAEQVVGDVVASAFDSAGQRCSALRVLCLQEEVADRTLEMLRGAVAELVVGATDRLAVDIGPVITAQARDGIEDHIARMKTAGHRVEQVRLAPATEHGTFVAPTIIEIDNIAQIGREVFGPVLHVLRYRSGALEALIDSINATGYGLTFGLHTRLDATIERVTRRIGAGNLYVNRNTIGAVVGVQPFGGRGLSGTGPKAGGPLYLTRLVQESLRSTPPQQDAGDPVARALAAWVLAQGDSETASAIAAIADRSRLGTETELTGPVGEQNLYSLHPRGRIAVIARTAVGLWRQIGAVLATGNHAVVIPGGPLAAAPAGMPAQVAARISWPSQGLAVVDALAGALVEGDAADVAAASRALAKRDGAIVTLHSASSADVAARADAYPLDLLCEEVSISINTTAAGGNASLMTLA